MTFARCYFKTRKFRYSTGGVSYTPPQLAKIYNFPPFTGKGLKIALIELGGGFIQADYDAYRQALGFAPSVIHSVSVDGGANRPGDPADGEVMLDICIAGTMAPDAQIIVYFAPNTDQGFADAVAQAVADKVDAISISWGAPEDRYSNTARTMMSNAIMAAQASGIVVTVAAGDNGSSDGERVGNHTDFPASHPSVLSCGGTALINGVETVWNDGAAGGATGGGVSAIFPLPSYQNISNVPGGKFRGVPDVAGVADPDTGWQVIVDGQMTVIGGTSAVAPMWAALAVLLKEGLGGTKLVGSLNAPLYAMKGAFTDIRAGNNGTYLARVGWDCCTGLGTPNGVAILAALKGTAPPLPPPAKTQLTLTGTLAAGTYTLTKV